MTAPTLTLAQLKNLRPCAGAFAHIANLMGPKKKMNAAQARAVGIMMGDIVWAAAAMSSRNPDVRRRVQLWLADCAAHVLHLYERNYQDDRPRNAIAATRSLARMEITEAGWRSAWKSARSAARINVARAAGFAAWAVAMATAWGPDSIAAWYSCEYHRPAAEAASAAARTARVAAAWAASTARAANAAWIDARDTEQDWQFDRLIAWLGDQEPTDYPLPLTETK